MYDYGLFFLEVKTICYLAVCFLPSERIGPGSGGPMRRTTTYGRFATSLCHCPLPLPSPNRELDGNSTRSTPGFKQDQYAAEIVCYGFHRVSSSHYSCWPQPPFSQVPWNPCRLLGLHHSFYMAVCPFWLVLRMGLRNIHAILAYCTRSSPFGIDRRWSDIFAKQIPYVVMLFITVCGITLTLCC